MTEGNRFAKTLHDPHGASGNRSRRVRFMAGGLFLFLIAGGLTVWLVFFRTTYVTIDGQVVLKEEKISLASKAVIQKVTLKADDTIYKGDTLFSYTPYFSRQKIENLKQQADRKNRFGREERRIAEKITAIRQQQKEYFQMLQLNQRKRKKGQRMLRLGLWDKSRLEPIEQIIKELEAKLSLSGTQLDALTTSLSHLQNEEGQKERANTETLYYQATYDALVGEVRIDNDQKVHEKEEILTIMDLKSTYIEAFLPQGYLTELYKNKDVKLVFDDSMEDTGRVHTYRVAESDDSGVPDYSKTTQDIHPVILEIYPLENHDTDRWRIHHGSTVKVRLGKIGW